MRCTNHHIARLETRLSDSRVITMWMTTEANNQSSLHSKSVLTGVISDHTGH